MLTMPLPRANAGGDASLLHEPARPSGDSRRRRGGRRVLGGLIVLGGAEFRLPLLVRVFGYDLERAVFLNLAVSLVTVVSALASRLRSGSVLVCWPAGSTSSLRSRPVARSARTAARFLAGVSEAGLHRAVRALEAGCTAGASVKPLRFRWRRTSVTLSTSGTVDMPRRVQRGPARPVHHRLSQRSAVASWTVANAGRHCRGREMAEGAATAVPSPGSPRCGSQAGPRGLPEVGLDVPRAQAPRVHFHGKPLKFGRLRLPVRA